MTYLTCKNCFAVLLISLAIVSTGISGTDRPVDSHFIKPGNSRLAKVVSVDGKRDRTYRYDEVGRLIESKSFRGGALWVSLIYSYDDDGRLQSRLYDVAGKQAKDVVRQYVYDGHRLAGYFSSATGEKPDLAVLYEYSGKLIVGYKERLLDNNAVNPSLADGTLIRIGSYAYTESGHLRSWKYRNADGTGGWNYLYETNLAGQRTGAEISRPGFEPYIVSSYIYEAAPCLELPQGTIAQWICVQIML